MRQMYHYRFVPCMASGLAYYLSQKFQPQMNATNEIIFTKMNLQRALSGGWITIKFNHNTKGLLSKCLNLQEENMHNLYQTVLVKAFPYKEMVTEWNGSRVHVSEYEPKQPQLDSKTTTEQIHKDYRQARPA
jgi:hypothetical protein